MIMTIVITDARVGQGDLYDGADQCGSGMACDWTERTMEDIDQFGNRYSRHERDDRCEPLDRCDQCDLRDCRGWREQRE